MRWKYENHKQLFLIATPESNYFHMMLISLMKVIVMPKHYFDIHDELKKRELDLKLFDLNQTGAAPRLTSTIEEHIPYTNEF